ncbi:DUF7857 domain-containing protein [Halogranum rubrum]|uniref:DUF8080 domain-containing protein n=1 Tax=Halogranum salarium B-1 TaxID=1210908 RepID=J3JG13_9EURY|nr:hypothetical protein [Halogranum salarium]EJN59691.1 hypothetical protein HSB1_18490 [Halogranum salarium B-1]
MVISLDCETTTLGEVTLVTVRLDNDTPVDRDVRLRNCLDGPVMPPRTDGVPEAGWDDDGFETVVPANTTLAVGYACPAPERDPPVVVASDERATEESAANAATPDAVVRRLGRATPPRDAVPLAAVEFSEAPEIPASDEPSHPDVSSVGVDCESEAIRASRPVAPVADDEQDAEDRPRPTPPDRPLPDCVETWLTTVQARLDYAERLTEPSVSAATEVLADVGGLEEVDGLQASVDADAEQLRAVAERAVALADRAAETDVALAELERLA